MPPTAGRRNAPRGYGSRNGAPPKGPDPRMLLAIIGGGGLVVILLIVVLLSRGGGTTVPANVQPLNPSLSSAPAPLPTRPTPKSPPAPLNQAEKDRIHSTIARLAGREAEVRRLVKEGFEAQNAGDNDEAQVCWRQAHGILRPMIEESELLFEEIGDERVEMYASRDYNVAGEWGPILSQFLKYLESR